MLKSKQLNFVKVSDWDILVESTYGRPYNFQQQDGCKERGLYKFKVPEKNADDYENDEISDDDEDDMGVSFAAWLSADPKEYKNRDWDRNFYPEVGMIINDLYEKGLIEQGEYAIEIDW